MIKKTTDFSKLMTQFAMVGQLGLSLVTPLLICIFVCYLLTTKLGVGGWVYIIGFFFGLGGSAMTAYKVYLEVDKKNEKKKRPDNEVSFNKHI
ncbi:MULTISPECIES: AtpZ/AtpI family protein [unclassified Butyrivibrio]|uniref:AtpZ/AtpI family protein n=1 Tax=unclassified Butyrivibrio TaxID=2639466 RepID=UPI0003B36264|nr:MULTISPECIES: AtpZ/AtpI family protein [unclassified Butyrivibrio]SDB14890.1 Putative F0F1-ATPase subunit Ca2+/Mg2+ transporter [Butyrivibrio sp. INlla16]